MKKINISICRFFNVNKEYWTIFAWVFFGYILYCLTPKFLALCAIIIDKELIISGINFFYNLFKELFSVLVTGIFFYLTFETFQEISQMKNELSYITYLYKQMKINILDIMLKDKFGLKMVSEENLREMALSPQKAKRYFTQEKFWEVFFALDDEALRDINREFQHFISESTHLNYKFVQDGDHSLPNALNIIKEFTYHIEKWIETGDRPLDWDNQSNPKSTNRLYLLFCQENTGNDPIVKLFEDNLKKYTL